MFKQATCLSIGLMAQKFECNSVALLTDWGTCSKHNPSLVLPSAFAYLHKACYWPKNLYFTSILAVRKNHLWFYIGSLCKHLCWCLAFFTASRTCFGILKVKSSNYADLVFFFLLHHSSHVFKRKNTFCVNGFNK